MLILKCLDFFEKGYEFRRGIRVKYYIKSGGFFIFTLLNTELHFITCKENELTIELTGSMHLLYDNKTYIGKLFYTLYPETSCLELCVKMDDSFYQHCTNEYEQFEFFIWVNQQLQQHGLEQEASAFLQNEGISISPFHY